MYQSDPEHLFLKYAYKAGAIDADQLLEFNRRSAQERPGDFILELLVEWDYLTRERIAALLEPGAIREAVERGQITESIAGQLESLEAP